ncbi:MBL fold metallo-hydrolase [Pseudoxanthomonas sp.]|uniref:MBL fold metallo-hydrolase n=1 Tax=Pseudoxanthomonas sp. TaxID=1871049 RepID=UPI00261B8E27|nr:MBL fold metallo-hydrolase [Pseudoxanthomonas sp.]WDS36115.1 MAG: MBL fold metallo-hydrolase [Pseudoxanthomonas sp.]
MGWTLRFQGVGNASAVELGSAMATIERDGAPWLTIDCGSEGLDAFIHQYGHAPSAVFVTHTHLDHVGGFERLFGSAYFNPARRGQVLLYVPAPIVPLLHQRVAEYPNVLAEGGANFWDAFRLVPVGEAFWHDGVRLEVFPVRHHWPQTAFGLRLPHSLVWTGDTRPIPEMLARYADADEVIAHDCALHGNPSHSGIEDLEREYAPALLARCVLYHHASADEAQALVARGHHVALPGQVLALRDPMVDHTFS